MQTNVLRRAIRWLLNERTIDRFATVALLFMLGLITWLLASLVFALVINGEVVGGLGLAFGVGLSGFLVLLYQNAREGLRQW